MTASKPDRRESAPAYRHPPLEVIDGIPVFSNTDDYIRNYEHIAGDHLEELAASGRNPFMRDDLWEVLEDSTAALLRKHLRPGDRILDAGVGLGRLLERFPEHERYGIDISLPYLRIARDKGMEVCLARIEDLPYAPESFDAVVCTDVLEHVLDLNLCVRRLLDALRPGGLLIARVPYKEPLASYLEPGYPYHYAHLRNFDEFGLALLFERVFSARVVGHETVGYTLDPARLKYPLPVGNRTLARLIRLVARLLPALEPALAARLFTPVEINVVVRK